MSDGDTTRIASWDVEGFRAAVRGLDSVLDRLPGVRQRFDDIVGVVWSGQVWNGPGATAAAGALSRVSSVLANGCADLDDSLVQLRQAVTEAADAQEAAVEAEELGLSVNAAAAVPTTPELASAELARAARFEAAVERARRHAADAAAAAERADEGIADPDRMAEPASASRGGWLDGVPGRHLVGLPRMPSGQVPGDTAAWWSVMSPAQQLAAIARDPSELGGLAGIPAWARDRSNRLVLAQAMAVGEDEHRDTMRAIAREISEREAAGEQVQLLELDVEHGLVALALGDVDSAEAVGILVPGKDTDVPGDLDAKSEDAAAVADAAQAAAPGLAVATVAWLGYRTPSGWIEAGGDGRARTGGGALDISLLGLHAARAATGAGDQRVTVVAHSYGTKVVDQAADRPGTLEADAIVLNGSPGMDNDAAGLETPEVYEASAQGDWVTWAELHGNQTWDDDFGAVELPTDWSMGHSDYLEPDEPTLAPIGEVVAGER